MTNEQNSPVSAAVFTREAAVEERVRRMLSLWSEALCLRCQLAVWSPGEEGPVPSPSVLFLDLRSGDGLLAEEPPWLKELPPGCAIVILSDDQRQAIRAYQWHPAACLSPRFTYEELCRTMDRCFRAWRHGLAWLDLPFRWERVRVPVSQIRYAEGMGRDTILHCTGGQIRVNVPLSKLEPELPSPPFFRCHKSFLIHPDAVEKMTGWELIMKDRLAVSIARNRKKEVQRLLEEWMGNRGREM